MAFSIDALANENRWLTRGAANCTCGTAACEPKRAMETAIAGWAPAPHAALQCREEWEVQSVTVHDVPDSDMRIDADALPYMPETRNIELPVEAIVWGKAPLIEGTT